MKTKQHLSKYILYVAIFLIILYELVIPILHLIDKQVDCDNKMGIIKTIILNFNLITSIDYSYYLFSIIFNPIYGVVFCSIVLVPLILILIILHMIINASLKRDFEPKRFASITLMTSIPFLLISNTSYVPLFYRNEYCLGYGNNTLTSQNFAINIILTVVTIILFFIIYEISILKKDKSLTIYIFSMEVIFIIVLNLIKPWTLLD